MIELSIIIPAYQAEKTLERCVESILDNKISKEILIVDDGSLDKTAEICQQLSREYPEVRCWSRENSGPGAAREFALQHAKGEFVTFVDADDYLSSGVYEKLIGYLDDQIDILEYGYNMVSETGEVLSHHPMKSIVLKSNQCGMYFARHWNTTNYMCNKLFRRALFEYVTVPHFSAGEDYATLAQLFVFAKGYRAVEEGAYQYVMTADSLCRKAFSRQRLDNIAAGQYVKRFYQCMAPELCKYAQQKVCASAANLYCQCAQSQVEDKSTICQELKCVFHQNQRELGMVKMLQMGSLSRRMMLILFAISPKLCAYIYRRRVKK